MSSEFNEWRKFISVLYWVSYKLWLLRNVLNCQMFVFCGLGEVNAENKQIKKEKNHLSI